MSIKLKVLALMALVLQLCLGTSSAWASDSTSKPKAEILGLKLHPSDRGPLQSWKKIGADPFTGHVKTAGAALMKKTAIRISEVQEAWQMRGRGECHSYYLKNTDELRTTFGADKSIAVKVNFTSPAGHPERRGDVCLVRPDGTAVVFLDGCGNVSVALTDVRKEAPKVATGPAPVNGQCGSNARQFSHSETSWPAGGTFCAVGTVSSSSILLAQPGSATLWSCVGQNGGASASCQASRAATPVAAVTELKPTSSIGQGLLLDSRSVSIGLPTLVLPTCGEAIVIGGVPTVTQSSSFMAVRRFEPRADKK